VINLSVAGPQDKLLRDLIREGVRRGVLFVGAASDLLRDGDGLPHQHGVIEVASAENHAAPQWSLQAPGREILTLLPGGHYDFASGDSIATAQVSGVVALLLARNRTLSADAALKLLRETSTHSSTLAGGNDRIDACMAVVALVGRGSCNPSSDDAERGTARGPEQLAEGITQAH
jgi:hypothetical protein